MKLIIEKLGDKVFAYRETAKHFAAVERVRKSRLKKLPPEKLDHDCDLFNYYDFYMVLDISSRKK